MVSTLVLLAAAPTPGNAQTFTAVPSPTIGSHVSFSTGVSWVDFDGDFDLDLMVVTGFAANNNNVPYRNNGGGTFTPLSGVPLAQDAAESACSTWSDYDNDGDVDCFVSNLVNAGGMLYEGQNGSDLTLNTTAGIGGAGLKGTGAAWGDYDNDGRVDLVIAALFGQGGITTGNRLFHNNGGGTFTEVTTGPVVTTTDSHHHPTWSDYDGDGDLDLFFGTGGPGFTKLDRMYRNLLKETGSPDFQAIATAPIATDLRDSQVLMWVDYDNDGDLDMYAVNYSSVPNQLYRNDGGTFTKITTGTIVTDTGAHHGAVWGDFDNDGDQDVYVARDNRQSNRYYRNEGNGTFTRITSGPHVTEGLSNYAAAAGDYDRDGDLDLFVPTARSEAASVLYRNDTVNGNGWLIVKCAGTMSNRSGIGCKVRVKSTIGGLPRWQLREILAGTSYGGHNALEAHFGLGTAAVIETVLVQWPSGLVNVRTNVAPNQLLTITEDSSTPLVGAVLSATASVNGVRIEWSLPGMEGASVGVQRAEGAGSWLPHSRMAVSSSGVGSFRDSSVRPGVRYGYRLEIRSARETIHLGETWIGVPGAVQSFGIERVWPNPTRETAQVEMAMDGSRAAEIEAFDVSGRRVMRGWVDASEGGEGSQRVISVYFSQELRAGVYFLRLTQGDRHDVARVMVSR